MFESVCTIIRVRGYTKVMLGNIYRIEHLLTAFVFKLSEGGEMMQHVPDFRLKAASQSWSEACIPNKTGITDYASF